MQQFKAIGSGGTGVQTSRRTVGMQITGRHWRAAALVALYALCSALAYELIAGRVY